MNRATKYKNGKPINAGDKVVGLDNASRPVSGVIVAGEKPHHAPFALKITLGKTEHVVPSLDLSQFLPVEATQEDGKNPKPAPAAAKV